MIPTLYLRIAGIAAVLLAIVGAFWYVQHLQGTIESQKASLLAQSQVIEQQQVSIKMMSEDKKVIEERLKVAQTAASVIRERVITQIKRVPAPPKQCEPAINWLRDRALELQGDSK